MIAPKLEPSKELVSLIGKAASSFIEFSQVWEELKHKGAVEGYNEKTLQGLIIEQIKTRQLSLTHEEEKLTDEQIKKKVWYLLHKEEHKKKQRDRDQENAANLRQIVGNKNLSHSSYPDQGIIGPKEDDSHIKYHNSTVSQDELKQLGIVEEDSKSQPKELIVTSDYAQMAAIANEARRKKFFDKKDSINLYIKDGKIDRYD